LTARYVTWEARSLAHLAKLDEAESTAAYVMPLFSGAVLNEETYDTPASVEMPPVALQRAFDTLEVDLTLTCEGTLDSDCASWDHCITLEAYCGELDGAAAPTVTSSTRAMNVTSSSAGRRAARRGRRLQEVRELGERARRRRGGYFRVVEMDRILMRRGGYFRARGGRNRILIAPRHPLGRSAAR
jgi:hypothetical protein